MFVPSSDQLLEASLLARRWGEAGAESDANLVRERVFDSFLPAALKARRLRQRVVIFDIGANNGAWSEQLVARLAIYQALVPPARLEMHLYEPQPRFARTLRNLTSSIQGATFHAVAAWRANTTLTFYLSHGSMSASLNKANARAVRFVNGASHHTVEVPAIDLASAIKQILAGRRRAPSLLKLDIESAGTQRHATRHRTAHASLTRCYCACAHLVLTTMSTRGRPQPCGRVQRASPPPLERRALPTDASLCRVASERDRAEAAAGGVRAAACFADAASGGAPGGRQRNYTRRVATNTRVATTETLAW